MSPVSVEAALTALAREEGGRVLALLASRFRDLDLADEAVQDALESASRTWPANGVPGNPAGWLFAAAQRRAIDLLRRRDAQQRRLAALAATAEFETNPDNDDGEGSWIVDGDDDISRYPDERLRLFLLCCHPALDQDAQVALTLRLVAGLSTAEIAAAFLVPEATMAQRLVRAKRKIRDAAIPLSIPTDLSARLMVLMTVVYLIFNEGYLSRGSVDSARPDLMHEAIRLTKLVADLVADEPEVDGLLALELFHQARHAGRFDGAGELVLLADQDRTTWDLATITTANALLQRAMQQLRPGPFQVQALIAAHHAAARTAADTDWSTIATLYSQLVAMTDSPVVRLNHSVAVAEADGPRAGLALLDAIEDLDRYHLYHAARGELLARDGSRAEAHEAFSRAVGLTENPAERRHLERRRAQTALAYGRLVLGDSGATLVLVHGAWHGAWCWEAVQQRLGSAGVASVAVDLPGHGTHPGPLTDLAGDAAEVTAAVEAVGAPVILVGHSYGGAVISTVAATTDLAIAGLVFVAAYRLGAGESVAERAHSWPEPSALSESIGFDGDALVLNPASCAAALYGDCDAEVAANAIVQLGPQSATALTDSLPLPTMPIGHGRVPEHYVVCTRDRAVPPGLQRDMAVGCDRIIELDTDHSPFLSRPVELAELLAQFVSSTS